MTLRLDLNQLRYSLRGCLIRDNEMNRACSRYGVITFSKVGLNQDEVQLCQHMICFLKKEKLLLELYYYLIIQRARSILHHFATYVAAHKKESWRL
jgi:hypothetical protein